MSTQPTSQGGFMSGVPIPNITGGPSGPAFSESGSPYSIITLTQGLKLPSWPQMLVAGMIVASIYMGYRFIKK